MPRTPPGIPGKQAPPDGGSDHARERLRQFEQDRTGKPAPSPPDVAPPAPRKRKRPVK